MSSLSSWLRKFLFILMNFVQTVQLMASSSTWITGVSYHTGLYCIEFFQGPWACVCTTTSFSRSETFHWQGSMSFYFLTSCTDSNILTVPLCLRVFLHFFLSKILQKAYLYVHFFFSWFNATMNLSTAWLIWNNEFLICKDFLICIC